MIILPEVAFNVGWKDIAFKIDRFIKEDTNLFITNFLRKADPKIPHVATLKIASDSQMIKRKLWLIQATEKLL